MEKDREFFWTGLSPEEARQALADKDKSQRDKRMTLKEAVDTFIKNGDTIGVGGFVNVRQPIAIVHEMIRHGFKDLTLAFQSAAMGIDFMGGAMMVRPDHFSFKRIELAYWAHEAYGITPTFRHLAENQMIEIEDWSNYNMSARFKAGSIGIPFIPTKGPIAGDIPSCNRTRIIDDPFTGKPIALLPAMNPNVGILHVQAADKYGNCIIRGTDCTCPEIAMASARTIVTCEQLVSHELITRNPKDITIPFPAVDAVVEVPFGAYPGGCRRFYYFNEDHIMDFFAAVVKMSRQGDDSVLKAYYDEYIFGVDTFEEYLAKFPLKKLMADQKAEFFNCERLR
ncbi:MAG: CoA-transferase [Desulfobacterales bacterium]|nr:MAG: CoA-transferase [Desulfobacterales bacterium]